MLLCLHWYKLVQNVVNKIHFFLLKGFDAISTTGEEVKNPKKALPLSILITLIVCSIAYLGVAIVVTLMIPYYLIDIHAPFPSAFAYVGYDWAKYVVSIGALISLSTWFVLMKLKFLMNSLYFVFIKSCQFIWNDVSNVKNSLRNFIRWTFI